MLLSLQIMLTCVNLAAVGFAVAYCRPVLRSISLTKRLTAVETSHLELLSLVSKTYEAQVKLSKRQSLADYRAEKRQDSAPAASDIAFGDKAALRARYLRGVTPVDIARNAAKDAAKG